MGKLTIELINTSVEIAMWDFTDPDHRKKIRSAGHSYPAQRDAIDEHTKEMQILRSNWMNPDNKVRWFEKDNAGHINGTLLDDKLKVVVSLDGKKVDSFKAIDYLHLFCADHVYSMYPLQRYGGEPVYERISALELFKNSTASANLEIDNDHAKYLREQLSFLVTKVAFVYHPVSGAYSDLFAVKSVQLDKAPPIAFEVDAKGETIQHTWWHQYGTTYEPNNVIEKKRIKRFTRNFLSTK